MHIPTHPWLKLGLKKSQPKLRCNKGLERAIFHSTKANQNTPNNYQSTVLVYDPEILEKTKLGSTMPLQEVSMFAVYLVAYFCFWDGVS